MSYSTRWAFTTNGTVAGTIAMALVNAAVAISSEAPSTANHANRVALAKQVVLAPLTWGFIFAPGVLDNLVIDTAAQLNAVTDAQIDGSVSALWNAYAGVQ